MSQPIYMNADRTSNSETTPFPGPHLCGIKSGDFPGPMIMAHSLQPPILLLTLSILFSLINPYHLHHSPDVGQFTLVLRSVNENEKKNCALLEKLIKVTEEDATETQSQRTTSNVVTGVVGFPKMMKEYEKRYPDGPRSLSDIIKRNIGIENEDTTPKDESTEVLDKPSTMDTEGSTAGLPKITKETEIVPEEESTEVLDTDSDKTVAGISGGGLKHLVQDVLKSLKSVMRDE